MVCSTPLGLPVELRCRACIRVHRLRLFGADVGGALQMTSLKLQSSGTPAPVRVMTRAGMDVRRFLSSASSTFASRDDLRAAHAFVGDDDFGVGTSWMRSAMAEKLLKTTECTAPMRTREHRVCRFGDHRHVDGDRPIALWSAARFQHIGKAADFVVQFAIRDVARFCTCSPRVSRWRSMVGGDVDNVSQYQRIRNSASA